ncbi:MAG TPA: PilT/PilU family type 4a pilus ATPase [Thermoanaerobaculia bacterium]
MTDLLHDPELDRLVEELNQPGAPAGPGAAGDPADRPAAPTDAPESHGPALDRPALADVEEGEELDRLLAAMVRSGASDLHLVAGLPPICRVDGRLARIEGEPPFDAESVSRLFAAHLGQRARRSLDGLGYADFTLRLAPGRGGDGSGRAWRFRVNLHRQRGGLAAAVRCLPREIPSLARLNLPPSLADLVRPRRGLVLVCGPTGAGKSSTLAALVGEINRTQTAHVITIEDPVEFEHPSERSVVEHVEIGRDARSFPEALRASLRQDPDVILVGEMRDLETVRIALTAAETGHLVLSTLHTHDSAQAIHRIVDVFPGEQQAQIRHQLSLSLHAIVTQQLIPRSDGPGRVPAVELLLATHAVRNLIRNDHLQKLYNEMVLGKRQGTVSLEESLARLVSSGVIEVEEARIRTPRPQELDSLLAGPGA